MPCPLVQSGDIVLLKWPDSYPTPNKKKYCLCICVDESLFFIVNTNSYQETGIKTQIEITPDDVACLQYDSFVDTRAVRQIPKECVVDGAINGVWKVGQDALQRIKWAAKLHGQLPVRYEKLLDKNWP